MTATYDNLINGEWVAGIDQRRNVNPSDLSDVIGLYASASEEQACGAVAAAQAAFPAWSRGGIQARHDSLQFIAGELMARREEIGDLLAREEGKTRPEGIGEATRAAQIFDFFAGEVIRQRGEKLPSVRPGIGVEITREPLGTVGIITPWNFPIAIPAWKIAPALAFGNCVIFKPADLAPGCAWTLAEIISRSGIPAGVFNLVMGPGSRIGQVLLDSRAVNAVTFTGSVTVGGRVAASCASRHAKFQLEMGGKNPLVVLGDADLDNAVECAVNGAYYSTGQRCTASSRLIVTEDVHDQFVERTVERLNALVVDDARKPGTQMGPAVDESQMLQDLDYIEIGKREGAKLVCGGDRLTRETDGFYLSPALFIETRNDMRINREEIFGPVATVIRVGDYDEALAVANETEFGLSAGICTRSLKYATHFKRNSEAGMVMVNLPTAGVDYHVPFGGRKGSSYGPREQGSYAAEFYTTVKTAYEMA
ncbi:MAG: aldehyde dehydrogenase family protein [Lysobacterales bacterium]